MGNAPSLERAMRAAPELASEHGLELNRFSKKQAAASTGAMSRYDSDAVSICWLWVWLTLEVSRLQRAEEGVDAG